jgi:hypothetical protein
MFMIAAAKQAVELAVTYKDLEGRSYDFRNTFEFDFGSSAYERYSNTAVRKAVLLTRFVNGMKWWITDHQCSGAPAKSVSQATGIPPPPVDEKFEWGKLRVSDHYKAVFARLLNYYERECEQLADAGDVDDHLHEHAKKLVDLVGFVAGADIVRVLPTLATSREVEAGLTADDLRKRCEEALKAPDLSHRRSAFKTEIKRRLKEVVKAKLEAKGGPALKEALEGPAEGKDALITEVVGFIASRNDQQLSKWTKIATNELYALVTGSAPPQRRMHGFVM